MTAPDPCEPGFRRLSRISRLGKCCAAHITVQEHHTSTNVGRLHFGLPPLSAL
jgi:hypothetical protein